MCYLNEPFRSRGYPDPDVAWFAPPGPGQAGWRRSGYAGGRVMRRYPMLRMVAM